MSIKRAALFLLSVCLCVLPIPAQDMQSYIQQQKQKDIQRAAYWTTQGYNFDPTYNTAFMMDQKVKDIQRAAYWKTQGYAFDPTYNTAFMMDQKVKDIQRAAYWKTQGYAFDPTYNTAFMMDQKVKDIQRAAYWKQYGYNFDPTTMSSYSMDLAAKVPSTTTNLPATVAVQPHQQSSQTYQQATPSVDTPALTQTTRYPSAPTYVAPAPHVAENGSYYGQLNANGIPKTVSVRGYFRKDGTYVRGHYRSRPRR